MAEYGLTIYNNNQQPVFKTGDNVLTILKKTSVKLSYKSPSGTYTGSMNEVTVPLGVSVPTNAALLLGRAVHKTNGAVRNYTVISVSSHRFSGTNLIIKPKPIADGYGDGSTWESTYDLYVASNQTTSPGQYGVSDFGAMPTFVKSRTARINFPAFGHVSLGATADEIPIVTYSSSYFCPMDSNTIRGDRVHSGYIDVLYVKKVTSVPNNNYGIAVYDGNNSIIVTNDIAPLQLLASYSAADCRTKSYTSTAGVVLAQIPWFTDVDTETVYYHTVSMRIQGGTIDYQLVRSNYYAYTNRNVQGSSAVNTLYKSDIYTFYGGTFLVLNCKNIT
ncbi:hypothetical protein CBG46_09855 [Actinobacillus succinogenes]|nr:hypothetical protein [Actinobacillus succinogenes]PHI40959.1 hypothetical protein CBG46_09855 [Actinobacillus succinogenes]